jgi:electron transfer flavoprotein beta subunit
MFGTEAMNILVCVKHVIDPEILARDCRLSASGEVVTTFPRYDIDQYDQNALEIALKLKDRNQAKVTVLCVGPEGAEDSLRKALALQADRVILASAGDTSERERAKHSAAFVILNGEIDLVLCGRVSSDTDSTEFGPSLAASLGWAVVPNVVEVHTDAKGLIVKRECRSGLETLSVTEPVVMTVTSTSSNKLRSARLPDVMRAHRLKVEQADGAAVEASAGPIAAVKIVRRFVPPVVNRCRMVEEDSSHDLAATLTQILLTSGYLMDEGGTAVKTPGVS